MTNQIYFFYTNYAGESRKMKVSMYQTRDKIVHGFNVGPKKMIRCNDCQANDWVDDGRNLNEYTCNCCGNFITVTEMRK